jgi:hypothetical protein
MCDAIGSVARSVAHCRSTRDSMEIIADIHSQKRRISKDNFIISPNFPFNSRIPDRESAPPLPGVSSSLLLLPMASLLAPQPRSLMDPYGSLQFSRNQNQMNGATPPPFNDTQAQLYQLYPTSHTPLGQASLGLLPPTNLIQEQSKQNIPALVADLLDPNAREAALLELSKKREQYDDLALLLWHSFGVMASLLQEIVAVYPLLSPPSLTAHASNRVCNALALLQCVASHSETRQLFLNGLSSILSHICILTCIKLTSLCSSIRS